MGAGEGPGWSPRGLGRPHREGHRRRRGARGRLRRGLGRPYRLAWATAAAAAAVGSRGMDVINDKLSKCKEKRKMRQVHKNQASTNDLQRVFTCLPKNENYPTVNLHAFVVGFTGNNVKCKVKKGLYLKTSNLKLKL